MSAPKHPHDPRDVLRRHQLHPKRSFSQNFLIQRQIVEALARVIAESGESVVELGPGVGTLTHALLNEGCDVVAVDLDPDMVRVLESELGEHPGITIVRGDAAETDFAELAERVGQKVVVAGNLPYQSTGAIIRQVVAHRESITSAVLMVQREVRDRLIASPSTRQYGALTVFSQAAFEIETIMRLKPGCFYPAPKVESAVVRLTPHPSPRALETAAFREVVRAAFQQRRKTLRNALSGLRNPDVIENALRDAEIDGSRRGETLSVEEFAALAKRFPTTS